MEKKLNILYLHGYGSKFDPESAKVQALKKIGDVSGPDLNYGEGQQVVIDEVLRFVGDKDYDLIVGTSMGGWLASHMCQVLVVPFCALNPAVKPSQSLKKYIGQVVNYVGHDCRIDTETVNAYEDFKTGGGCGHILCEEGDEVIDARACVDYLQDFYGTTLVPGGSHRFESLEDHLEQLQYTAHIAGIVWGNDSFD